MKQFTAFLPIFILLTFPVNGVSQNRMIFPRFHGHIVKHSFSIHTASGSDYQ